MCCSASSFYQYFSTVKVVSLSLHFNMKILNAQDVPQQVKDMQISAIVSKMKYVGGPPKNSLFRLTDQDDNLLLIRSQPFLQSYGQFTRTKGVFPIDKEKDSALYNAICHIEQKAELALVNSGKNDVKLRPTYSNNTTAWLKLSQDFTIHDWEGKNRMNIDDISTGYYQIIVRAYNVYNGRHGATPFQDQTPYNYSILFRIVQIRYSPTSSKLEDFMFDPNEPFDGESTMLTADLPIQVIAETNVTASTSKWRSDNVSTPKKRKIAMNKKTYPTSG